MDEQKLDLDLWIEERHKDCVAMKFRVKDVLFSGRSEFQKVDVVETQGHGRMLLNDGLVMVSEKDEFIYHEMVSHVPLYIHPNPKHVLIIGGGDGGTAREVLRHPTVETCDMVEIDAMVVEACRKHIPQTAGQLDHPRLNLKIEDGVKFVAESQKKYDVVIVDSTEPFGPATPLFDKKFYQDVFNTLSDDGIVVSQGESPYYNADLQESLLKILGDLFPVVSIYNYTNLTYPGGNWSFTFGSKKKHPLDVDEARVQEQGLEMQYYNVEMHRAAFALPSFMKRNLASLLKGSC